MRRVEMPAAVREQFVEAALAFDVSPRYGSIQNIS